MNEPPEGVRGSSILIPALAQPLSQHPRADRRERPTKSPASVLSCFIYSDVVYTFVGVSFTSGV